MTMRTTLTALLLAASMLAQTSTWVQRTMASPPHSNNRLLVYDTARSQTLLLADGATWVYDGIAWALRSPAQSPPNRGGAACCDLLRSCVVGVFGDQSSGLETWEWDGATWQLRATGVVPARGSYSLAYDGARHETILYGGTSNGNDGFGDTWAWDGATWRQLASGGPSPRWGAAMVFDDQRQTVLLFGGMGSYWTQSTYLAGTWEWNGSYWLEHFGITEPSPRTSMSMAYDSRRARTVLYGGTDNNGFSDTWEWDGAAWMLGQPIASPPPGGGGSMVYDADRGVSVMWVDGQPPTTWEYVVAGPVAASFTQFGQGCPGPSGVPTLAAATGSLPHLGTTFTAQLQNLPPSPINLPFGVISLEATTWNGTPLPVSLDPFGFTGCQAWIAPEIGMALANNAGAATWSLAVPLDLDLIGVGFYLQGAVLAPGWNPGGIVFSNAGSGVVGWP